MSEKALQLHFLSLMLFCCIPFLYGQGQLGALLATSIIAIGLCGGYFVAAILLIGKFLIYLGMPQALELFANILTVPLLIFGLILIYAEFSGRYYAEKKWDIISDAIESFYDSLKSLINEIFFSKVTVYESHEAELDALAEGIRINRDKFILRGILTLIITPIIYLILSDNYFPETEFFLFLDNKLGGYKYALISILHFFIVKRYNRYQGIKIFNKIKEKLAHLAVDENYVYFETNDDISEYDEDRWKLKFKLTEVKLEPKFSESTTSYFRIFEDGNVFYYFHPKIDYDHFMLIDSRVVRFKSLRKFHDSLVP